ncbi:MAG: hypothetical protein FWB96_09165 [Defluviitaleaceae bacterium]|nr:hypothetical protein [Defluviitaleaceae bacterium]MCL2263390.1 hypothetical protein [Defluviitaleaceae bacterium]
MDAKILDALKAIRDNYGDGVFYNLTTARNLLNDLAPTMRKERIQIVNLLEIGGYFQLKYAEDTYPIVRERLISQLIDTFAVDEKIAEWVLNIFSEFLGFNINDDGAVYRAEELEKKHGLKPPLPIMKERPASAEKSPFVGGTERRPLMTVPRPKFGEKKAIINRKFAQRISADLHSVAVTRDGHARSSGPNPDGQCHTNTFDWRDMKAVSAGAGFTIGLRKDGTVLGVGRNDFNQLDVKDWTDIVTISAGARHTVGLRADGTLLACGKSTHGECKVAHWRNITHIVAGQDCTFGIKKDGRVLVSGNNKNGDLQVSHLENVADIAYAAPGRILALLQDGTIARVGRENHMRKSFERWRGIRQISAAPDYFAALFENGTVRFLAYFWPDSGAEAATMDWREIVAIAAGRHHIVGWKANGTLIAEMLHPDISRNKGQLNVGRWEM